MPRSYADPAAPPTSTRARDALAVRLGRAVGALPDPAQPLVVVDLDAFDANAADLVRRAGGKPVRLASKSVRVPALLRRALAVPGFAGVLAYAVREAIWLVEQGVSEDVVVGYPSVDRGAIDRLLDEESLRSRITLMVDDPAHLDLVDTLRRGRDGEVRVAIDVDAGLRLGRQSIGPQRSPLFDTAEVVDLAALAARRPGFRLVGVMTYEGQVAGVPDDQPGLKAARSAVVRRVKQASVAQLGERRARLAHGLDALGPLEFFNAGGTGSLETSAADAVVTEVAAGSGLFVPASFDHFRSFEPRPAAFFAVPVVRRPGPSTVTVAGGGFAASGPVGPDRAPVPWAPSGLHLTGLEGAGEVQTPLTGPGTRGLGVGDLVWFRHAKAGELMEHAPHCHLVRGDRIEDTVTTYRGEGRAW